MDSNRTRTPNGDYMRKASMSRARSAEPLRKESTLPVNLINIAKRSGNVSSSVAGDLATPAMNGSRPFNVSEEVEKPHRRRRRRKRIEDLATPATNGSRPFNVSEEMEKPHRRRRRRKRIEVIVACKLNAL
uniref:Uncharacterized protein n=1 Tax=Ascaris lumbricoides TaxID=6252 RepID=A0A0M3IU79_ASCLU